MMNLAVLHHSHLYRQAVESEHCTMCSSLGGSSTAGSDYVLFPVFVEAVASTVVAADRVCDPFMMCPPSIFLMSQVHRVLKRT